MKTLLLISLLLISATAMAQEPTVGDVCEEWSHHLHDEDERSAYDRICSDMDTTVDSPATSSKEDTADDLATTEEAELWVQLFDSGNSNWPLAAGVRVAEDFLGNVDILIGGVTCDLYDEYLLADEWAIISVCISSFDTSYRDAPDTIRVEMYEDLGEPTSYYRCVESVFGQEEGRRLYACERLTSPPSVIPTEMWIQLFDSGNSNWPLAAGVRINVNYLGNVDILIGGVTCDLYNEYLLADEWAIISVCISSIDLEYQDAPDTIRVEMQEDWGEPTSYFRCVESADTQEEERRMYACEFLRSR